MFYTKETFEEKCLEKMPDSNFKMIQFNGIKNPCSFLCLKCNNTFFYQQADKIIDRGRRGLKNVCKFCEDTKQKYIGFEAHKSLPFDMDVVVYFFTKVNKQTKEVEYLYL